MANLSNINNKFLVTTGGDVGIGTTSPQRLLQLRSTNEATGIFLERTSNYGFVQYNQIVGSVETYHLGFVNNNTFSSDILVANESGSVGIGTTSPTLGKLQVAGSGYFGPVGTGDATTKAEMQSNAVLRLKPHDSNSTNMNFAQVNGGAGIGIQTTNGPGTANWDIALSPFGGNVGIGTVSPTALLDLGNSIQDNKVHLYASGNDKYGMGIRGSQFLFYSGGLGSGSGGITFGKMTGTTYTENMRVTNDGNVGIGVTSPFSRLQSGSHTFSGGNGMAADSRVGISNHGLLTGMMLASTYNDPTYPEYGLVFVQGPDTSNYNVWSISPDCPAKGDSLNFIYGSNATNIHVTSPKVIFDGNGHVTLAITNATSSTTIGKDGGGMWMETAGSTNALSDMRFQARASGAGSYSAIRIKPSNQSLEFQTSGAVRMLINSAGDVQIPTDSASLQLRSSGSSSYTSIRRDSANQLIVANTAGNQVFGIGNGGELRINNGASYSAQYTYTSGWNSSMQTLIPGSSLSPNAVYLVTIKCNSFGAPPYYASTVFHIATSPGTNGTGGSVPFNPPTATHVSSNAVWTIRISTIVNGRNGLEGYLIGGPTNFNGATIYVKATKIMTM